MTQSQSKILFHNLTFHDDLPKRRDVEARLTKFLRTTREKAQRREIEAGRMTDDDRVYPYDLVDEADMTRIKRRTMWFLDRKQASTGMHHLTEDVRVIAAWRTDFNHHRPHSSLAGLTPAEYVNRSKKDQNLNRANLK